MSSGHVQNPFEVPAVPKWFSVVGFAIGVTACWLLSEFANAASFEDEKLWPPHALVIAVLLNLVYQLILLFSVSRNWDARESMSALCNNFLHEYEDVANPEQVEVCANRLQGQATSVHNLRFALMAGIALPVSVLAYLMFLLQIFRIRSSQPLSSVEVIDSLLLPLIECLFLVTLVGVVSLYCRNGMTRRARLMTEAIRQEYRSGGLARRAKRAASPPQHDLTPPFDPNHSQFGGPPTQGATIGFGNDVDDDEPPAVLGGSGGPPKAEPVVRSRRRRGGV